MKDTNSLDLLVTKQGNFLYHDQDMVEIDAEFTEALKIADEHNKVKQKEAETYTEAVFGDRIVVLK